MKYLKRLNENNQIKKLTDLLKDEFGDNVSFHTEDEEEQISFEIGNFYFSGLYTNEFALDYGSTDSGEMDQLFADTPEEIFEEVKRIVNENVSEKIDKLVNMYNELSEREKENFLMKIEVGPLHA